MDAVRVYEDIWEPVWLYQMAARRIGFKCPLIRRKDIERILGNTKTIDFSKSFIASGEENRVFIPSLDYRNLSSLFDSIYLQAFQEKHAIHICGEHVLKVIRNELNPRMFGRFGEIFFTSEFDINNLRKFVPSFNIISENRYKLNTDTITFIKKSYLDKSLILEDFDIPCFKVGYDSEDLFCTVDFLASLATGCFPLDITRIGPNYLGLMTECLYYGGFGLILPQISKPEDKFSLFDTFRNVVIENGMLIETEESSLDIMEEKLNGKDLSHVNFSKNDYYTCKELESFLSTKDMLFISKLMGEHFMTYSKAIYDEDEQVKKEILVKVMEIMRKEDEYRGSAESWEMVDSPKKFVPMSHDDVFKGVEYKRIRLGFPDLAYYACKKAGLPKEIIELIAMSFFESVVQSFNIESILCNV